MKKNLLVACIMLASCAIVAQHPLKKWDGGGRNNRWDNAANWQPNGVPGFDSIVLDNSLVTSNYQVVFPDTALGRVLFKITVMPDTTSGRKIELILPATNSVASAVQVGNIELRKGAVLRHSGGGGSGISQIDILGSFRVKRGAEYIHNSQSRHNFLLTFTELDGTVRFKVPAYSYNIDLNCLCNKRNIIFDGSAAPAGASEIIYTTEFDTGPVDSLIIGERALFEMYYMGQTIVAAHIVVDGTLDLRGSARDFNIFFQPWDGSPDASLSGSGTIAIDGRRIDYNIPSGVNFQLKRNLHLGYLIHSFNLNAGGTLEMGSHTITGTGTFKTKANSKLQIGSPDGIWATAAYGNVQTATRIFDDSTSYEYKSSGIQHTGDGLPATIQQLIINKPSGDLQLTRSTTVRSNIKLLRGKLKTTASKLLTYHGDNDYGSPGNLYGNHYGWENSFVDGPMAFVFPGAAHIRVFPIGKGSHFAPFMLLKKNAGTITYTAEYFPSATTVFAVASPLHHISRIEHWTIRSSSPTTATDAADDANIWLTWRPMSRIGSSGTDRLNLRVARMENSGTTPPRYIAQTFTGPIGTPTGYHYDYMMYLQTVVTDFSPEFFTLGSLTAGNPMTPLDPFPVTRRGQTIAETNAILYPNPVENLLHVNIPGAIEIINAAGQVVIKTSNQRRIDMSRLPAGTYFLRAYKNAQPEIYPFVKR